MKPAAARDWSVPAGYEPGQVISERYRLISLIAEGGMGCVWKAFDQMLEADVALKLMFPSRGADPEIAARRAHSEARFAARLRHPAVCAALDYGVSEQGDPYIVSELLDGEPLDRLLSRKGRLDAVSAAKLMLPILDGLSAAHAVGIVHRDIKPSNIFLAQTANGRLQPKLLDFGIARCSGEARVTVTGTVCGTPDYMSPEQARGSRDIDWRSDLWSVCASLYELVTGRVPFPGDNYNAVMFAVIQGRYQPLHELSADDAELGSIIELGLRKQLDERIQSAQELADLLTRFLIRRGAQTDASGGALSCRTGSDTPARLGASMRDATLESVPFPLSIRRAPERQARTQVGRARKASRALRKRAIARLAAGCALLVAFGAFALAPGRLPPVSSAVAQTGPAVARAALEIEPVLIEASPEMSSTETDEATTRPPLGRPARASADSKASAASSLAAAAPPGAAFRTPAGSAPPRPQNALGYDFGL